MGATERVRRRCRVAAEQNGDGAVTLYGTDGRTYQVIDATERVGDRAGALRLGDTVAVVLEPVRCRGDGWRLVRLDGAIPSGRSAERPGSASEGRLAATPER
jgi:hypothetical protein